MRKLVLGASLLSVSLFVLGCPKKGGDAAGDAAAEAAAVVETPPSATADEAGAAAAVPPPPAKNEHDVARYKGETALGDDDAKVGVSTTARTAPKTGATVATIPPGTDVGKQASYQDSVLVTFASPTEAGTTLMGWVPASAFSAPPVVVVKTDAGAVTKVDAGVVVVKDAGAVAPTLTCPTGSEAIQFGTAVCKKKCTKDADCKTPTAGACAIGSALNGGRAVRVCIND